MTQLTNTPDTHNPDSYTHSHNPEAGSARGGSLAAHLWSSIAATLILTLICCGIYPLVVWGIAQWVFPTQANGSLVRNDGSFTTKDDEAVGSALLGQNFSGEKYFHSRPSSAGSGYDAANSGGSNLGPLSAKLLKGTTRPTTIPAKTPGGDPLPGPDAVDFDGVSLRVLHYCIENKVPLESSQPIEGFKDKDANLDDVKLIKAFNDEKNPLTIKPKVMIPADAVTGSGSGLDPHISLANALLQAPRVAKVRSMTLEDVKRQIDRSTEGRDLGMLGDPGVNVLKLNLALDVERRPTDPRPSP